MPRYDFRCPHGHVSEIVCSMADVPTTTTCTGQCTATATRVFGPPAAIHFRGPGFYSTDVKGRVERKRRKMVADDMPRGDSDSHSLARRW